MFENLIKELGQIENLSIPIAIESDEKDYIDRQCPSKECEFLFKVNEDDWKNIFKDEAVWCPLCRYEAPADQWFSIAQVKHAELEVEAIVAGKIHNALYSDAHKFNKKQSKNSFISMSMKVQGGVKRTYTIPAKAVEIMQHEITCEICSSRFAVIGSAFFCPSCGHNSVTQTFLDSLRKIKAKRNYVEDVRIALTEIAGKDEAELTCRSLRETCISDGVMSFQKYCDGLYSNYGNAPFNAFQRLEQGSKLWKTVIQKEYNYWLTDEELKNLQILFQKRHILSHNEGIVDAQYITKSADTFYKEGQRIVISDRDIDELIHYLEKLGKGLKEACDN